MRISWMRNTACSAAPAPRHDLLAGIGRATLRLSEVNSTLDSSTSGGESVRGRRGGFTPGARIPSALRSFDLKLGRGRTLPAEL